MPEDDQQPRTMVVGIGASAGGLNVLKRLFSLLPDDSGMVFVVVVHLSPDHPSHLADLLQPFSPMPVIQVSESMPMEADRVYVIPPGRNLSTIDTHLRLSPLEEARRERAPIDHFLETLAHTHGEDAVGIILSGTGSDGTLGIKKIKEGGGLTIVQEPNEAEFDGMPQSAIATRLVDLILPVDAMPDYLRRFARTQLRLVTAKSTEDTADADHQTLAHIFAQLRSQIGQDFSSYKRSTVLRRLRRRMQLAQQETLKEYLALLRESPNEVRLLADDFLITVTQFFRDRETFDHLEHMVIPGLFEGRGTGDRIRVWSVGCATGEEAYSVAMLLLEHASGLPDRPELQVFASDLHEHSLQRAREGIYPETITAAVEPGRLSRFFTRDDAGYRVIKDLREVVVFANHNLLRDPPFSHMDLILCRNVLIYLRREAQHDVLDLFHYVLNPDGLLVLGPSESVDRDALFRPESKPHAVYRRRNVPPPEAGMPVFFRPNRHQDGAVATPPHRPEPAVSYGALHQQMVERYAPPSILVNQEGRVVHVSQHAGRYLQVGGGNLSSDLYKLTREELRLELHGALQRAVETAAPARARPVTLTLDGGSRRVAMEVRHADGDDLEGLYLILFDEFGPAAEDDADGAPAAAAEDAELAATRSQLQAVIARYESGQEEMRASNEELQSANEELRSAMEELETSKEELQSMNEELQAVNQENRHKVEELSQLTGDLNNLTAATEIATLFLDHNLRILRVTPKVTDLFNLRASDRGRPLTDFTNRLGYEGLAADAARVLDRLVPVEREVRTQEGDWYAMRVLPYRSGDRIQGVVVTFVEITGRKNAELLLARSEERFRALVTASSYVVFRMSPDWSEMRELDGSGGLTEAAGPGTGWLERYVQPEHRPALLAAIEDAIARKDLFEREHRVRRSDGSLGWTLWRVVPIVDDDGEVIEWFGAASDVTPRKRAEEALREADQRKDHFLAALGHELRNPMAALRTAAELFKEAMPEADQRLAPIQQMMERQVDRLVRQVDDLLDLSRIKSGLLQLQPTHLDLRRLVDDAAADMAPTMAARGHRLAVAQPESALTVVADPLRLAQVVTNLLDNAAKYTPQGGNVTLTTRRADGRALVSIKDDGIGMTAETLERVFEGFAQGAPDHSLTGGLGIGLSLTRRLVLLHGGTIEAHSAGPGRGSELVVSLPLAAVRRGGGEAGTAPDEDEDAPAAEPAAATAAPRRVLVVDDNPDVADSTSLWLSSNGHEVRTVYDAASALDIAPGFEPDIVVLDIGLPDMDGRTLAEALRRQEGVAPALIIAMSGYGQQEDLARSAAAGIDHHLVKPVAPGELLRLVEGAEPAAAN